MINVSFFLANPKANGASSLQVSVSTKLGKPKDRARFPTGEAFLTRYCNMARDKGTDLVKKGTPFYSAYAGTLRDIEDKLFLIEHDLKKATGQQPTPAQIQEAYNIQIGKIPLPAIDTPSFFKVFDEYMESMELQWSDGFVKIQEALKRHLVKYETYAGTVLALATFNEDVWQDVTAYFISKGMRNSNTNKYLKYIKQFLRYAGKKESVYWSAAT